MKRTFCILLISIAFTSSTWSAAKQIDRDDALDLARAAMSPDIANLPNLLVHDGTRTLSTTDIIACVLHDQPNGTGTCETVAQFAVHMSTGDVCTLDSNKRWYKVNNAKLLELQKTIRKRIGLTEEEYQKIWRPC